MKKGKIVKDVIGNLLFPLGFELNLGDGWDFTRTVKNSYGEDIEHSINIYMHRFASEVFLTISTNAYGRIPLKMDSFIPGYDRHPRTISGESIAYSDDDSFKDIIRYFANIIEKYILEKLDEMSEPATDDRFYEKEHIDVLKNHKKLCEDFLKREDIPPEINLEASAKIVYEGIKQLQDKPFQEIKKDLFDLGVFFACKLDQAYGAEWNYVNRSTFIDYNCGDKRQSFSVLDRMKWCWVRKDVSEIIEHLDELVTPVYYK